MMHVHDVQDIDKVMPMYNLMEYSDAYQETLGNLWEYYKDQSALDNNTNIVDFPSDNNNSISFKFKQQITEQRGNGGTKDFELMVPLKYLSNFRRTVKLIVKLVFS